MAGEWLGYIRLPQRIRARPLQSLINCSVGAAAGCNWSRLPHLDYAPRANKSVFTWINCISSMFIFDFWSWQSWRKNTSILHIEHICPYNYLRWFWIEIGAQVKPRSFILTSAVSLKLGENTKASWSILTFRDLRKISISAQQSIRRTLYADSSLPS